MRNETSKTLAALASLSFLVLTSFVLDKEKKDAGDRSASSLVKKSSPKNDWVAGAKFSWSRTDTSIALRNKDRIVWQFNYNKSADKPFFYPLQTAGAPYELAGYRPADHPWHRGLWFSWKLINGVNYWEEEFNTRLSDGRSQIQSVDLQLNKNYSALIKLKLAYAPQGKETVLNEDRILFVSAPDHKGNYYIDWELNFQTGDQPVVLDRTPPQKQGGPFYGGYAGLSFRAAENIGKHSYKDSKGWTETGELVGRGGEAAWMDLSGNVDAATGAYAGLSMFDHPANVHAPAPWYVYKDKQFAFMNAALLFDKPISLRPSAAMRLTYRVLVHQDTISGVALTDEYRRFIKKYPLK